jgi:hypothetical protein
MLDTGGLLGWPSLASTARDKDPPAAGHPFAFITAGASAPRDARARATVPGEAWRVREQWQGIGGGDPGWTLAWAEAQGSADDSAASLKPRTRNARGS